MRCSVKDVTDFSLQFPIESERSRVPFASTRLR